MNPRVLLMGGAVLVAVAGIAVAMLAQDARNRRLTARIAEMVTPLAAARAPSRPVAEQLGLAALLGGWQVRLARVCGYNLDRRSAYPLRVPVLLALAVIPAVLIERLAGRVFGLSLDVALPLVWAGCTQALFRTLHAKHADKLYRQLPDALSMIVRSVRAGIPLQEALRGVAREIAQPTGPLFARVSDQMAIGIRLDDALRDASARSGVAEYGFFTVALTLQAQTGGSLAETLENLADVIRKRVALRQRAVALASEARTSAYVLAALPVVTGLALTVLNYAYIRPLFDTSRGNRVLFLASGMLGTAGIIMRVMIKRSLR
ncbi:MAG: type II secretion system F family protein [Acetobacteraceae bacterium]